MIARNPITGALIRTKNDSRKYSDNFDAIFGKKEVLLPEALEFEAAEAAEAALQRAIKE